MNKYGTSRLHICVRHWLMFHIIDLHYVSGDSNTSHSVNWYRARPFLGWYLLTFDMLINTPHPFNFIIAMITSIYFVRCKWNMTLYIYLVDFLCVCVFLCLYLCLCLYMSLYLCLCLYLLCLYLFLCLCFHKFTIATDISIPLNWEPQIRVLGMRIYWLLEAASFCL